MAKNFSVEVLINTAKATKDLQAAEGQVRGLDRSLQNLTKTLKESNGSLDAAAKSIASIVASSRDAARASEDLAKAKIAASKADQQVSRNTDAAALSAARLSREEAGLANTLANTARQQTMTANTADLLARRQEAAASATDRMGNSLSNQRYLLYDVGATYRTLAIAAQAIPAASLAIATSYEKSFAQVIRTSGATGEAVGTLRGELKALGTEIPLTFSELASIAQIGGQMNIPAESLGKFTEVVAKFVATADGVTIDKATESFGRLANLFASDLNADETADFFERIGSAISFTADNSVTSEAKISASLEKIAPIGKAAGLSAVEITAFASALSSVGLAPEISSGFLTRFFGNLNKSVATNSETLQVYAGILGKTTEGFKELYQNDPNAVLTGIVTQLSKLDKVSQTKLLGEIGITGVRDIRVIQGLAQNLHVLEQAQTDTAAAFASGSYLDDSSAKIFGTFAANLQKFGNALMNIGDTLGSSVLPIFSTITEGLIGFSAGFDAVINQVPLLKGLLGVLLAFGSVAGVWLAVKSAQAFVTAGLISLSHAQRSGVGSTLTFNGQLRRLGELMLANKGYTDAQTAAILRQTTGVRALTAASTQGAAATTRLGIAQHRATAQATGFAAGLRGVGSSVLALAGGPIGVAVGAVAALTLGFSQLKQEAQAAAKDVTSAFAQSAETGVAALTSQLQGQKASFLDSPSVAGKSYLDLATSIGVSVGSISTALAKGSGAITEYRNSLIEAARQAGVSTTDHHGQVTYSLSQEGQAYALLIKKLQDYEAAAVAADQATSTTADATGELAANNIALGDSATDLSGDLESEEDALQKVYKAINDNIAAAFGLVDAQGAVQASLEKLGSGLQDTTSFGADSEGGRNNLANLQASLATQAALFQQNIDAGKITAEQASAEYGAYVTGLIEQLVSSGVDPSQIQGIADQALSSVQGVFEGQIIEIPLSVDDQTFLDNVVFSFSTVADFLAENELSATLSADASPAEQQAYDLVLYLSELTGLPFEAVLTAFGDPASQEAATVGQYMNDVLGLDYQAVINADTTNAVTNVSQFGAFAQSVVSTVSGYLNDFGASVANTGIPGLSSIGKAIQDIGGFVGGINFGAPAIIGATKAAKQSIPQYKSAGQAGKEAGKAIDRGFKQAEKAANGSGKSAGNAGKAAKGAGKAGKKAGDDLKKAAEKAKKEWDAAEQAISGYASRIGSAFGYVIDRNLGVQDAKDEYYSVLNGIKERLEAQKQTLKDLRAENKALNAERKVQINDAENLERLAKIADLIGDGTKAKQYRDEAKALRASADETKNKVDQNNKEVKALEKGIGNLKGYSQAAIDNREDLRRLRDAGLKVAESFAASGSSAKKVKEETEKWTKATQTHGKELGYTRKEVESITGKTKDYTTALSKVPKTIKTDITENKTTNLKATNQTGSGVAGAKKSLGSIPGTKNVGVKVGSSGVPAVKKLLASIPAVKNTTVKVKYTGTLKTPDGTLVNVYSDGSRKNTGLSVRNRGGAVGGGTRGYQGFASGGTIPGTPPSDPREDNLLAKVDGKGHIAVRSGEFIQRQEAVDYYGSGIMNKINNMEIPRYALGGQIGNRNSNANQTGGVIELGAETIQSLARLNEKVIYLYAGLEEIANSVNMGNQIIAQKGGHGVLQ